MAKAGYEGSEPGRGELGVFGSIEVRIVRDFFIWKS